MRKKLRVWFVILSLVGWLTLFFGLGIGSWVAFSVGLPLGLGCGAAAFALKTSPAPTSG